MFNVKFDGLDQFSQKIAAEIKNVEDGTEKAVESTITHVATKARELVPVDSGELHDAISEVKTGVVVDCDHAAPVEFGTFKSPAQPFLRPASIDADEFLAAEIKKALRK